MSTQNISASVSFSSTQSFEQKHYSDAKEYADELLDRFRKLGLVFKFRDKIGGSDIDEITGGKRDYIISQAETAGTDEQSDKRPCLRDQGGDEIKE
jgi:hypothetical protein